MNKVNQYLKDLTLNQWAWIIFILNVAFRLPSLFAGELWLDEAISVFHTQQSWEDIYAFSTNEPNPPLFYYALSAWIKLFGTSEPAVRALPMLFMSLAGVYVFKSLYQLEFKSLALISAFFFLTNNRMMWYTNEVRTYSLVVFLATLSTYYFILFLKNRKISDGVILAFSYAAMLYSHYFSFWIPLLHFIFFVFNAPKKYYKAYGLVILGSLLLFSPFIGFALYHTPDMEGSWLGSPSLKELFKVTSKIVEVNSINISYVIIFQLIGFASLFLHKTPKKEKQLLLWMFIATFGVIIFTFLLSQVTPVFRVRYIVYAAIPSLIISAYGFLKVYDWLDQSYKNIFLAIIVFSQFYQVNFSIAKGEPFKEIVERVKTEKEGVENVIIYPWYYWKPFSYYYDNLAFKDYQNTLSLLEKDNIHPYWKTKRIRDHFNDSSILILYRSSFGLDEILTEINQVWPNHSITPMGGDLFLYKGEKEMKNINE